MQTWGKPAVFFSWAMSVHNEISRDHSVNFAWPCNLWTRMNSAVERRSCTKSGSLNEWVSILAATLFCSFVTNVTGIKFYEGHLHLRSVTRVLFEREFSNPHDSNAILVKLVLPEDCVILGHLERRVSSIIAPLMKSGWVHYAWVRFHWISMV